MATPDLNAALDALFAVTPEQFLQTRDALVKELKASGEKDASAQVKAQHKPTLVAHALNRLAREAGPALEALLQASRALASGKDFKGALEKQRAALDAVSKKATGADVPAVMTVVRGAQVDDALAEQVRRGRFSKVPEVQVGFFGAAPIAIPETGVAEKGEGRGSHAGTNSRAVTPDQSASEEPSAPELSGAKTRPLTTDDAGQKPSFATRKDARPHEDGTSREPTVKGHAGSKASAAAARLERRSGIRRSKVDHLRDGSTKLVLA